jgi:hypothetical protein
MILLDERFSTWCTQEVCRGYAEIKFLSNKPTKGTQKGLKLKCHFGGTQKEFSFDLGVRE